MNIVFVLNHNSIHYLFTKTTQNVPDTAVEWLAPTIPNESILSDSIPVEVFEDPQ
jgi:hypothetical protein